MFTAKHRTKFAWKLFAYFALVVILFVSLLAAEFAVAYKPYVVYSKERQLLHLFEKIRSMTAEELANSTDNLLFRTNIRIFVFDNELEQVKGESFSFARGFEREESVKLISRYTDELSKSPIVITKEEGNGEHKRMPASIRCVGRLDSGGYIVANMSYAFVSESIEYTIPFIVFSSVFALLLCVVFSVLLSKQVTRPIVSVSEVTKKIAALDFSEKCAVNSNDEIGALADNVNMLSSDLKRTITELKEEIEKERKIDEMRKNLIINVSHELKTPIFLIRSYADGLALDVAENKEDREYYCRVITEEAERMDVMVKELLSLARLEAGKQEISRSVFSLSALVADVLKHNGIILKSKGIRLECSVTDGEVYADEALIRKAVNNIIINAIDHTPENGEIRISSEANGGKTVLKFYNSGAEIAKEELDKIWQSFYKVDKSRSRTIGGSGIGLSIVKAVMDSHGCSCGVHNCGGGVEFFIELENNSN